MTTTAQSVPAGGQTKPRKKSRINRWDSPWLNPKFLIGLGMVVGVMLMGPIGRIVWQEKLSYPASSPLNLPPPWAPGLDQTGLKIVEQTKSVSSAATAIPASAEPAASCDHERRLNDRRQSIC